MESYKAPKKSETSDCNAESPGNQLVPAQEPNIDDAVTQNKEQDLGEGGGSPNTTTPYAGPAEGDNPFANLDNKYGSSDLKGDYGQDDQFQPDELNDTPQPSDQPDFAGDYGQNDNDRIRETTPQGLGDFTPELNDAQQRDTEDSTSEPATESSDETEV